MKATDKQELERIIAELPKLAKKAADAEEERVALYREMRARFAAAQKKALDANLTYAELEYEAAVLVYGGYDMEISELGYIDTLRANGSAELVRESMLAYLPELDAPVDDDLDPPEVDVVGQSAIICDELREIIDEDPPVFVDD